MRIVDAHVHLWDVEAFSVPWFRDELQLPRVASARMLRAAAADADAVVAVQVADTAREARWLLDVARQEPLIAATVLQYEPGAPHPLGATVDGSTERFAAMRAAVPQFAPDLSDVPGLDALASALSDDGKVLELLVRAEQLTGVAALAGRHPRLAIVVCHLGLGHALADGDWKTGVEALAAQPNAHAKVSGLLAPGRGDGELAEIVGTAFGTLGAERLMFGSDWPMSARTHAHSSVIETTRRALPSLTTAEQSAFWSGTAIRLYGI
ncbi:amidohydrolase family protein [Microbacterium sp.]|uniref:amidohydrolase family protein n=1 Tax=Microbacterium sp. TaxID=51671 RepID=UPI002810A02D|nr:amidohydrolase family protein [Microbacterium sp.]